MEGAQNGTIARASELLMNDIRNMTKTTIETTHWNGSAIVIRIKIRESPKEKCL